MSVDPPVICECTCALPAWISASHAAALFAGWLSSLVAAYAAGLLAHRR